MQRQKSIRSFFQKPSPAGNGVCQPPTKQKLPSEPDAEIRGTDTPPEKVPRQILPASFAANGEKISSSFFASIAHKFARVDEKEHAPPRDRVTGPSNAYSIPSECSSADEYKKQGSTGQCNDKDDLLGFEGGKDQTISVIIEDDDDDDVLGPETPGTCPFVPRMKRVQEEAPSFSNKGSTLLEYSKQLKLVEDSTSGSKNHNETVITSKLEWLKPTQIKDAKRRRPGDPLSDKKTPAKLPFVPQLKRVQEEVNNFSNKGSTLLESRKRLKLVEDSPSGSNNQNETDIASKFEWLNPAQIKDANGRRPGDPLYDKKTLCIPPDALRKMSASQKQYWSVKCKYMDVVLFFKVGKFYELYELDAEIGHKELDWKLTVSGVGKCRQVGVSESGIDDAVQKLTARGYKVGRMEQLESSEQAKARGANSVIQRKLVQVFTPSTSIDDTIGPDAVHLLVIREGNVGTDGSTVYGFAFVDCAALRFWVGSINDDASCASLGALLMQVSPKEVVYENQGISKEAQKALRKYSITGSTAVQLTPALTTIDFLDATDVRNLIVSEGYFKRSSNLWSNTLDETADKNIVLGALGGLISHLSRLMLDDVLRNGDLFPYQVYKGCLKMDGQTLINLEIFNNNADGGHEGTLFKYLDNCTTSSGKRLLRNWLCHPLKDVSSINCRLDVVEKLMDHLEITSIISQYLRKLPDLERLLGRVKASAQSSSTLLLPVIGKKLLKLRVKAFGTLVKGLRLGIDLLQLLQKEGDIMQFLSKLFNLPVIDGKDGLSEFLSQFEAAIESDFPNYQNHDPTDADAEILSILVELLIEKATQLSEVIHGLNCIDVLTAFAVTSSCSSAPMTRPVILPQLESMNLHSKKRGPILKTERLWHPFALGLNGELPVPNDTLLGEDTDGSQPCSLLLTGPNMGGKSTLLRSICLAVILAQVGCYVPSRSCVLSIVDKIFTRLGATDRIMTGESTFLVECTETAAVLQNATQDSLVLLDELGRGTSTFDGYAIAFAVFRHLVEKVNCRLLFATHYHPLTKEFASHPRVKLQHMACDFKSKSGSACDNDQELVFLYRLADGACPESYGLQVAAMAGIPKQVVRAAVQAARAMKRQVGESFRSSERRSEFSTLHEEWLRTLIGMASIGSDNFNEEDVYDTFFCLWHELKRSHQA